MPQIYLFYPFDDGTADRTVDNLIAGFGNDPTTFQTPKHGQIYRVDSLTKATTSPGGLWDANNNDEIYVVGHSASGQKVIGDANGILRDQSWLLQRMYDCGLQYTSDPKIVLYCCESGKGSGCLAQRLANAMKTGLVINRTRRQFASFNKVWGFTRKVGMVARPLYKGAPPELRVNTTTEKDAAPNWTGLTALMSEVCVRWPPNF